MSTPVFGAPEFRARSGRTVTARSDGSVLFDHVNGYLSPWSVMDAEEFFQAKRDEDLGRWRWPENPQYVVYPASGYGHYVRVLNEKDAFLDVVYRDGQGADRAGAGEAARAYFEAHPERKPWEEAEPGEVWALRVKHVPGEDAYEIYDDPSQGIQRTCFRSLTDGSIYWVRSESIEDGRRIWPEDAS